MVSTKDEPVEYRYCSRSIAGVIATILCGFLSAVFAAVAFNLHWLFWFAAAFAILCTILAGLAFFKSSEWGCSVDNTDVVWWAPRTWPKQRNKMPLADVAQVELDDWGESVCICLTAIDGQVIKIDGNFIGNGKKIFDAIRSHNSKIVALRNGKPID